MKAPRHLRPLVRVCAEVFGAEETADHFGVTTARIYQIAPGATQNRAGRPRQGVDPLLARLLAEVFGFSDAGRLLHVSRQRIEQLVPGASPLSRGGNRPRRLRPTTPEEILLGGLGAEIYRARARRRSLCDQHVAAAIWRKGGTLTEIAEVFGTSFQSAAALIHKARRNGISAPFRRRPKKVENNP